MDSWCSDECYEKSCKDIKTRIFLISAFIVIIGLIAFSIYLVARPPICVNPTENSNYRALIYRQYYRKQPKCIESSIRFYPQVAAIIDNYTQTHFCSGVIISLSWMITAAHCLLSCKEKTCSNFNIRAGSTHANRGGHTYSVIQFEVHPEFNPATLENDIGLIKAKAFDFSSNNIKAAKISSTPVKPGQHAELLGWFSYSTVDILYRDNILRTTNLTIQSHALCRYRMKGAFNSFGLTKYMLCGTYPTTGGGCYTDAGGPFIINGVVRGVAMFGQICYSCDFHMSILTDISYFIDFIKKFTVINEVNIVS